jgi:hypothetical protein
MFDMAMEQFPKHEPARKKVRALRAQLLTGDGGVPPGTPIKEAQARLGQLQQLLEQLMTKSELSGPIYEDLIHLKSMYSRYQNYLHWLKR